MGRLKEIKFSQILKSIGEIVLKPLMLNKPIGQPLDEWLEYCFGIKDRTLHVYIVNYATYVPGKLLENAHTIASSQDQVLLEPLTILVMRYDPKALFPYEVSLPNDTCYGLTSIEWDNFLGDIICLDSIRLSYGLNENTGIKNYKYLRAAGCTKPVALGLAEKIKDILRG